MFNSTHRYLMPVVACTFALMAAEHANADGVGFMLSGGGSYAEVNDGINLDNIEDIGDIENISFDDSSYSYNLNAGWRFNK
jgi:hypothetical protein